MKISDLFEGMYIVKNKDGKEKRFKSADSADAKAWQTSSSKKPKAAKPEKYSAEWWDTYDGDGTLPWDKIVDSDGQVEAAVEAELGKRAPDDWAFGRHYTETVKGVKVAGRVVRLMYMYTKADDMGLDGDTEHNENVGVRRDVKNPDKFIFDGYK